MTLNAVTVNGKANRMLSITASRLRNLWDINEELRTFSVCREKPQITGDQYSTSQLCG